MEAQTRQLTFPILNGDSARGCWRTIHTQIKVDRARAGDAIQPLALSQSIRTVWALILGKYTDSLNVAFGVCIKGIVPSQCTAFMERWRLRDEPHLSLQEAVECVDLKTWCNTGPDTTTTPATCLSIQWGNQNENSEQEIPYLDEHSTQSVSVCDHLLSLQH